MSSRKSAAAAASVNVVELRDAAIAAVKGIESSYGQASGAILAFVLACKSAKVPAPVFESGIAAIAEAAPGLAKISVQGYVSNARRIWACGAEKLAEVMKTVSGLQSIAKACPAVVKAKAEGAVKREAVKAESADPKAPSAPVVKAASADPLVSMANSLVALRKLANGKKKARMILAAVGEIEDMIDEIKSLMAA